MESLRIPEKYKRTGLYVYCNKCHRYSNKNDGYLKKSPNCPHPAEKQVYKLKVHHPGTKNMCRTKVLNTRDIKEVDNLRLKFIKYLNQNNYSKLSITPADVSEAEKYLLTYQMKRYLDFITNGGFYEFESPKELSSATIKDYKRYFKYFLEGIAKTVDIKTIRIDEIQKEHIDLFHKYITKKTSSPKSYNNIMGSLRSFFNHIIKYEEMDIKNMFLLVQLKTVHYDNQSFTLKEFKQVLAVTNLANGYDAKRKRNRYREWLPTAFRLGVFTCLRLDELVHIKYSDIINDGDVTFLQAANRKANKLIGDKNIERIKRVPVIPELRQVLIEECELEINQDNNDYIIAPELNRNTVKQIITHGFTHFKRVAGIDDKKCFKELRKTYTSHHRAEYGDNGLTSTISDHSNQSMVDKHYTAQIDAVRKSIDFRVFPEDKPAKSE